LAAPLYDGSAPQLYERKTACNVFNFGTYIVPGCGTVIGGWILVCFQDVKRALMSPPTTVIHAGVEGILGGVIVSHHSLRHQFHEICILYDMCENAAKVLTSHLRYFVNDPPTMRTGIPALIPCAVEPKTSMVCKSSGRWRTKLTKFNFLRLFHFPWNAAAAAYMDSTRRRK
jgi:hypothetical protein